MTTEHMSKLRYQIAFFDRSCANSGVQHDAHVCGNAESRAPHARRRVPELGDASRPFAPERPNDPKEPIMPVTREIHLASRPHGEPTPANFRLEETELPDPGPGQVLVRNLVMSVDPYMRGRMNDVPSYAPPWQLDGPLTGGAVGTVTMSLLPELPVGTLVLHDAGWRDEAVLDRDQVQPVPAIPGATPSQYLGVLGMPGLTAYSGLFRMAAFVPGDVVFVSAAAGAVGSLVGQYARLRGASRVVGSAGTAAKLRYLTEDLGFDAAFDYHDEIPDQLRAAAPEGIDVYFDNVGGPQLEAAIDVMNLHGRIALSGSISAYNATRPLPGPSNHGRVVGKRLTLRGFLNFDHADLMPEMIVTVGQWLGSDQLQIRETVYEGLDSAVPAFIGMLRGHNTGQDHRPTRPLTHPLGGDTVLDRRTSRRLGGHRIGPLVALGTNFDLRNVGFSEASDSHCSH
jgi:NADPH-dependent curcumin reductase CurA